MSSVAASSAPPAGAKAGTFSGLRKSAAAPFVAHISAAGKARGAIGATVGTAAAAPPPALHDPNAPGATILNSRQWDGGQGRLRDGRCVTPMVIDP